MTIMVDSKSPVKTTCSEAIHRGPVDEEADFRSGTSDFQGKPKGEWLPATPPSNVRWPASGEPIAGSKA